MTDEQCKHFLEILRRFLLFCAVFNNCRRVTCGALNELDTDAQVCEALGIELALEKPFSPVGEEAFRRAEEMAAAADAVIICELPFGPGNTINLRLAENALKRGAKALINDLNLDPRDYSPGKAAADRIRKMLESGAGKWRNLHELRRLLAGG